MKWPWIKTRYTYLKIISLSTELDKKIQLNRSLIKMKNGADSLWRGGQSSTPRDKAVTVTISQWNPLLMYAVIINGPPQHHASFIMCWLWPLNHEPLLSRSNPTLSAKIMRYLKSAMEALVFDILICLDWLGTNHRQVWLQCNKSCNLQFPKLKIHNKIYRSASIIFQYFVPNIPQLSGFPSLRFESTTILLVSNNSLLASWWRHPMEIFSALLAICAGNSPVTGEFPAQRPVTRNFDVIFDLRQNKRLSKQWRDW